ncbi:ABC transporter domain-containing protein [Phthorimaea operculella]|nr:ABC transporter domain-containing protein [Phthorimaea operculella]
MNKISGRVNTHGIMAYVPQQAWIQNATLEDNILFGKPMEKHKYHNVINVCALKPDFDMLPGGDQTEIGEKGINLSGGQKQRVSLARAVYYDADNYLLDDPLSAVDSHVGKHIFDKVIGPNGLLKNKTRVWVTHNVSYLAQCDLVLVLKDGEVSEAGTYQHLLEKKGAFAEFLVHHLSDAERTSPEGTYQHLLEKKGAFAEFLVHHLSDAERTSPEGTYQHLLEKKGAFAEFLVHHLSDAERTSPEGSEYQHLLEKKGAFAEFLVHHLSDAERTSPEELDEIKQDLESKLGSEIANKLQRARSLSESASESDQAGAGDRRNSEKRKSPDSQTPEELKQNNKLIEAEKAETGSVRWSVYKHYLLSVGILASLVTVLMNLVLQVFQVGSNYWLARWSNDERMLINGTTVDTKLRDMYLGVYGGLGIGQVVSVSISSLALYLGTLSAARGLHAALLAGVLRAPTIGFFDCTPVGRVLNRFSKDVDVLDNTLPMTLRGWTSCFFAVLGTLFVISLSTPIFMAVILPIGIVYYLIQRFYVATSRQLKRLESVSRSPIYSHFGESITGAPTIRAYGVTQRFILESEYKVDHNQCCYYPSCIANRWLAVRLEMIGNLIIFFAALFAVLARDDLQPGLVGLSVSYALQITQTLNWLVRMTSEVETNIVAVERIKEYAETKQEAAWNLPNGPGSTWPETGALQLEQVSLGYKPGEPALRDVTCCVAPREKLGIVGRTGAGKSTLTLGLFSVAGDIQAALRDVTCCVAPREKLGIVGRTGAGKSTLTLGLFRIVEAMSGRILIDGIDISTLGLHQLRSRITIIPQDPVLFSGTLRTNLDPFHAYSDDELWRSLDHAHLKGFVQGLQAGLNHEISEGGENLSVGQRQLVCLARALLRKTPLLVLDEATAAVDLETDDLIQKTIRSEFASCTVLTIAHRLNTIMDSSKVMVLDRGQLVEYAPPQQLLQDRNSIFFGMAKDAGLVQ